MTAADLRPIAAALTNAIPRPKDCTDDTCRGGHNPERCPWLLGIEAKNDAFVTLVNHADALVRLAEACERLAAYELQGMDLGVGARGAVLAMRDAVTALHAVSQ